MNLNVELLLIPRLRIPCLRVSFLLSKIIHHIPSVHNVPVQPASQEQVNDPWVLIQVAPFSHPPLLVVHSSISGKEK